ncbi:MAG: N-acetylmuramoyl-L-alanine amidase family protein [Eubacterium sp.]|nr:N-acetylmuramoyl-L-alanine amidase family protein [Eubacterium sp.]
MKKAIQKWMAALLAAMILLISCTPAFAASGQWICSGSRWWYRHADASYTVDGWEKINNTWYRFDKQGWMQTGWVKDKGKWYYLNPSGVMRTGWLKYKGQWYYLNPSNGRMLTGQQGIEEWIDDKTLSVKYYYFDSNGAMRTGFQRINGGLYFYNNDGEMRTGWYTAPNGNCYFFDDARDSEKMGKAYVGWHGRYYFNKNGVQQKDTVVDGRYIDEHGVVRDEPGITLTRDIRGVAVWYGCTEVPSEKNYRISMQYRNPEAYASLKSFFLSLTPTEQTVPYEDERSCQHPIYAVTVYYDENVSREQEVIYVYPTYGVARCEGVNYTVDIDAFEALVKEWAC